VKKLAAPSHLKFYSGILFLAATTQLATHTRSASPIALWHLLSLDAPTVAALWTWFIARASHIRLPLAVPAAMFLAVWILYATDRILDARILDFAHTAPGDDLELRHHFHHRHRRAFLTGIALASAGLAALFPRLNPTAVHLYLVEGAFLVAWFLVVHTSHALHRPPSAQPLPAQPLPKEIALGLFFSTAVFIPTVVREAAFLRLSLLPCAVLFAALCSLNCLFICAWESRPSARLPHATTRLALARLPALTLATAIASVTLTLLDRNPISAACALASALLLLLHGNRHHLTRTHLRAAADLALLTPALLLPFLR
jgi:hypothetical protein